MDMPYTFDVAEKKTDKSTPLSNAGYGAHSIII